MQEKDRENIKIAVVLRTGRAAIGMNQQELSDKLGVAKSTVARAETLEMPIKADLYFKALRIFSEHGVKIDSMYSDGIDISIAASGLQEAKNRLSDDSRRRMDRKKSRPKVKSTEKGKSTQSNSQEVE